MDIASTTTLAMPNLAEFTPTGRLAMVILRIPAQDLLLVERTQRTPHMPSTGGRSIIKRGHAQTLNTTPDSIIPRAVLTTAVHSITTQAALPPTIINLLQRNPVGTLNVRARQNTNIPPNPTGNARRRLTASVSIPTPLLLLILSQIMTVTHLNDQDNPLERPPHPLAPELLNNPRKSTQSRITMPRSDLLVVLHWQKSRALLVRNESMLILTA